MPFDWREFFNVAVFLETSASELDREAVLRTAVGRAYYAAFNQAVAYCKSQGRRFAQDGSDHQTVRDYLVAMGRQDEADSLYRMHRWRKLADYDPRPMTLVELMWRGAYTGATQILTDLHST